jgi:conjugative relaxase-like TrwC/TraI family protein
MVCSIGRLYSRMKDYAQDNYYTQGDGLDNAEWCGQGATQLGLNGRVTAQDYTSLYNGCDREGHALRQHQSGRKSNPGRDITLSASKSVSLAGLVNGDPRVIEAHQAAVRSTMAYVERQCLFTRIGKGGHQREQTNHAVIAIFHHDDNRNQDPQLHSHCVLFNQTVGADGKWRTMDNRELYQQKMTIGAVYRHELASRLQGLGYDLTWHKDSTFEIDGYTPQQLQTFSTRRPEILAEVGANASAAVKAKACTTSRKGKLHHTSLERETLRESWRQQATMAGIQHPEPKFRENLEKLFQESPSMSSETEIVNSAITVISDRQVAFSRHALLRETLRQAQGKFKLEDIEKAIDHHPNLIQTHDQRLTTQQAVQSEIEILYYAHRSKERCVPLATLKDAQNQAQKFGLNPVQTKALKHFALNQDGVMLCQGDAGVGKTYTMKALHELVKDNCQLQGLAPSAAAVQILQQDTDIPAQTIDAYLATPIDQLPQNKLMIVDEAGMISTHQMKALLERTQHTNSRLLLIGDTKQLSAVQAGSPFQLLQEKTQLTTVHIDQNIRQKDSSLKTAVNLMAAGNIEQGYEQLQAQGHIREIAIDSKRSQAVIRDFLDRSDKKRSETLILASTNGEKQLLTAQVRQGLINQGGLGIETQHLNVLKSKELNRFDLTQANSYAIGDVIKFRRTSAKFDKNLYYRLTHIDAKKQSATLSDRYGTTQTLKLNQYLERDVFHVETREIRPGEQMRFTRNQQTHQQINGQLFTVEGFTQDGQIQIQTHNKTRTVNREALLHVDYSYVDTVHGSQGKTANFCLYAAGAGHSPAIGRESFYVAASRAKHEFTVYTAKAQDLGISIQRSKAQENALPLITPDRSGYTSETQSQRQPIEATAKQEISLNDAELPSSTGKQKNVTAKAPTREQEFQLLIQAKYLVEVKGKSKSHNPQEKLYETEDGTVIQCNGNRLRIMRQGKELEFDEHHATLKNTFSSHHMQQQIRDRTNEVKHVISVNRSNIHQQGISL